MVGYGFRVNLWSTVVSGSAERDHVSISAYACDPAKGSERSVEWSEVRAVSRSHEVRVITRPRNRRSIEAALKLQPVPATHWVYCDLRRWAWFWKKGVRGIHTFYYFWQLKA